MNNCEDGFPEHDNATISGYDPDMLRQEIVELDNSKNRIQEAVDELEDEKDRLMNEDKPDANRINHILVVIDVYRKELEQRNAYQERLRGYLG